MKVHIGSVVLLGVLLLGACNNTAVQPPGPTPPANTPFQYQTTQQVNIDVQVRARGSNVVGAPIRVFQRFDANDAVDEGSEVLIGVTDASGAFRATTSLPIDLTSLAVRVDYVGVISEPIRVDIRNGAATLRLNDQTVQSLNIPTPRAGTVGSSDELRTQAVNYTYQYLGGFGNWNTLGVPSNLTSNSAQVTASMLQTVNATLPERFPVPTHPTHSSYIARDAVSNLVLTQNAEVWLTFVHEGAGYKNSVGYYLFDANNPPRSVSDILGRTIVAYPNTSYQNSGGGLQTSNRVQLKHFDGTTWSNTFPAGTGIGWFLVANGWRSSAQGVLERSYEQTVFSDPVLNYQAYRSQGMTVEQSAQTVLLLDQQRQTLLLGFEDILRHHGGDQDFNDAIMLVEATPFSAVKTSGIVVRDPVNPDTTRTAELKPVDDPTAQDSDEDGVTDPFDAYPNDADKAFVSAYPSKDDWGTLVFEDLWPRTGDYDFNDAVIDYNIRHVLNANSQLVQIEAEYKLNALGGGFHSGFGFQTDLSPAQISQVSYTWERDGVTQSGAPPIHYTTDRLPNGLEANQPKATVIVFDDGYDILRPSLEARPYYANVVPSEPVHAPGRVKVTLRLAQPMSTSAPGVPPYNPFLIANGLSWGRGVEIHLPGMRPTAKADSSLFGTQQDTTDAQTGRYYMDDTGRPWAMHLPTQFTYVKEVLDQPGGSVSLGLNIRDGYLKFDDWVSSNGDGFKDWFRDLPNYRDSDRLFTGN
jgi:LruC domain-containing protein